jgi:hypothetical protein
VKAAATTGVQTGGGIIPGASSSAERCSRRLEEWLGRVVIVGAGVVVLETLV